LPEDDKHIIVTFHYYQPFQFTHQGAEWVQDSGPWLGTEWKGASNERASVDFDPDVAAKWGKQNDRPIFLGEFGAYSKADIESRHHWTSYIARAAEKRNISWAYWEFGAGFGVYDRTKQAWNTQILTALIPE
jgi:endoglucanase